MSHRNFHTVSAKNASVVVFAQYHYTLKQVLQLQVTLESQKQTFKG